MAGEVFGEGNEARSARLGDRYRLRLARSFPDPSCRSRCSLRQDDKGAREALNRDPHLRSSPLQGEGKRGKAKAFDEFSQVSFQGEML